MKRILFIFLIIMCGKFSHAQNPIPSDSNTAITQSVGNAPTTKVLTNILQAKKGIINATFNDTTAANNFATGYRIKYFPGAQIFSTSDSTLYVRNSTATRWLISSAEGNANTNVTYNQYGDDGVIICQGQGAAQVCDTFFFSIDSIYNVYPINDSQFVACDTPQVIQVGDLFTTQQVCDTITIPRIINYIFTNGLQQYYQGIVEHGWPQDFDNPAQLNHDTYLYTLYYKYLIQGVPYLREVLKVQQKRVTWEGNTIQSWNHQGVDGDNDVNVYMGYTDAFVGDTSGFVKDRVGYLLATNAVGSRYSMGINDLGSKQSGVLLHSKDTTNTDAVTIFGTQTPMDMPFYNTPSTSTWYDKRIAVFKNEGTVQFPYYPNTRNDGVTGIAFYPDADGNIKLGATAGGGSITFDNDTVIICSFGNNLCDTFITTLTDPIQYVTVIDDTTLRVCDTTGACENIDVGGSGSGGIGVDQKFFEPSQVQNTDTYHEMSKNFSVGINLTTSVSGVRNYNFLNGNTVSGSENVVWGRNMVVAGNTNFVAATDGQVFSSANYSSTFGDATINRGVSALTAGFGNKNWAESGFTMGSNNVNGSLNPTVGTANLYSNSTVIGLQNFSLGSVNTVIGYDLTANSASGYITQFGKSYTVTTPNSFNVGYTTNAFEITQNKVRINAARFEEYGGTTTAAANDLTLPNDGNRFTISGATQINTITTTNWQDGSKVWFIFSGAPLVKNNTAGTGATILLAGRVDFQAAAGDILYLGYNGTNWYEINRALAASTGGGSVTGFEFTDGSGFDGTVLNPTTLPTLSLTTTLTQGSVFFAGALGALAEDNTNLFFDNSNNVLGIGVNSGLTATRLNVVDNAVGAASIVDITSTSTAAASNLQKGINVSLSGANATASQTTYGIYSINTHSGSITANVGVYGEVQNDNTASSGVLGVSNTGVGVRGQSTSLYGVYGTGNGASGRGVYGQTTSGFGIFGFASSGIGGAFSINPTSTNTVATVGQILRGTTGTAADGIGGSLDFYTETDDNGSNLSNQVISKLMTAAVATRTSQYVVTGVNNASTDTLMTLGGRVALTETTATTFTSTLIATGKIQGGEILVTVEANDATDYQSRTLRFIWSAVNKAGTLTITISTPEEVVAVSSGTLTCTITAVDAGSGVLQFKADATSSLTQSILRATYQTNKNF